MVKNSALRAYNFNTTPVAKAQGMSQEKPHIRC